MQHLEAAADIDAPPEKVWAFVTDVSSFPLWSPFIVRAHGELHPGGRLRITLRVPETRPVSFRPRLPAVEPGREIRRRRVTGVRGLFDGVHSLTVEALPDGRSRLRAHEDVTGILLPVLGKAMRRTQRGFALLAEAVKASAEVGRA